MQDTLAEILVKARDTIEDWAEADEKLHRHNWLDKYCA